MEISDSSFSEKRFGKEKINLRILIIWECEDALTDLSASHKKLGRYKESSLFLLLHERSDLVLLVIMRRITFVEFLLITSILHTHFLFSRQKNE